MEFRPTKKQWEALQLLTDNNTTEIGYGGAAGGGKSFLGAAWIVINCLKYAGVGYVIGRKEMHNLRRTTMMTVFEVLRMFGKVNKKDFQYNKHDATFNFKNGSQIIFMNLNHEPSDPLFTRLGGLEVTGAFVDESNEVPMRAIEILQTRVGRRRNKEHKLLPKILETFNPDKGHVYRRFWEPYKKNKMPKYRAFIPSLATDNNHLDKAYIDQLKRISDTVTKQRLLYGNFDYDDSDDALMNYDSISALVSNIPSEQAPNYLTVDVSDDGKDETVYAIWNGMDCRKIARKKKQRTEGIINDIIEISNSHKIPFTNVAVDAIGVGAAIASSSKLPGVIGFKSSFKPIKESGGLHHEQKRGKIKLVDTEISHFKNLRAQCAWKLAEFVNERKLRLSISDTEVIEMLSVELSNLKDATIGTDKPKQLIGKSTIKDLIGRSPDISDTFIMRMYFELIKDSLKPTRKLNEREFYKKRKRRSTYA